MIKVLIVENETAPAEILKSHLKELFADVEILEVCETVETSLNSIQRHLPDLVFLDVELNNNENGFEILKKIDKLTFEIIVTTAYDKYAILACKASVIDYLVKPISKEELYAAIEKYKEKRISRTIGPHQRTIDPEQIEQLISIYQSSTLSIKKFPLPTMTGYKFVDTKNIIYFQGADNQTLVHFLNGKKEYINMLLKGCEKLLSHSDFCRIHKSYFINLDHIEEYFKGKDGIVIMCNKDKLSVSREYKDEFLKLTRGL